MRKTILLGALFLMSVLALQAQERYGHINLGNLIAQMPQAIAANDSLEVIQASKVAVAQAKAAQFERDAGDFIRKVQAGELTPVQQQQQQAALEQRQAEVQQLEQVIALEMENERNRMLEPIVDRAMEAIEAVAEENDFAMIFDTSIFGAIMYAAEAEDVMPMVKAKLGIE